MYQCFIRRCDAPSVYSLDYTINEVTTPSERTLDRTSGPDTYDQVVPDHQGRNTGPLESNVYFTNRSNPSRSQRDAAKGTSVAENTRQDKGSSFSKPKLFRRKTAAITTGSNANSTGEGSKSRFSKRSDLLRRRTGRRNDGASTDVGESNEGSSAATTPNDSRDPSPERHTIRRRHSASAAIVGTPSTTDLPERVVTRARYKAGESLLERMLPELFQYVADILLPDPGALIRVSHLSRRMRDNVTETIWKRACYFWDAKKRPEGWFNSWREFYIFYVYPTRYPKLEVLRDKRCFSCATPCPTVGRFLNNDRGLVPYGWGKKDFLKLHIPESGNHKFDYRRNGNLLYCPACRDAHAPLEEQGTCCMVCNNHTACAYVRLRVFSASDSKARCEEENARNRALASFGSAAAAASWRVGDHQQSVSSYSSLSALHTSASTSGTAASSSTSVGNVAESRMSRVSQLRSQASTVSLPAGLPYATASRGTRYEKSNEALGRNSAQAADLTVSTSTSPESSPTTPTSAEESNTATQKSSDQLIFWGQVWNGTTPCAHGILFPNGLPSFIDAQAVMCGDCVRSLNRLGYGQLEVAVRYCGVWALTN